MEIAHVISDAVLALVGIFVFFRYLSKLDLYHTLLWESFILSVAVAALFGVLKFAGVEAAAAPSVFFQKIAATVGAIGLVAAVWFLMNDKLPNKVTGLAVLGLGFLLFALDEALGLLDVTKKVPLVAMVAVAVGAIYGLIKGQTKPALWVLLGVFFAGLATFRDKLITDIHDSVDAYHYLLAASLICFGIAASYEKTTQSWLD